MESVDTTHPVMRARLKAGLTVLGLADKAGVSPQTIDRIERRKTSPIPATLKVIALALDVPVANLTEDVFDEDAA